MPQGNPFDVPLASEQQSSQAPQSRPSSNPFDVPFSSEQAAAKAAPTGPTIGPQPTGADIHPEDIPGASRLTMPLVKGLMALHDKLQQVQNLTQEGKEEHPILAKVGDLANGIEGLLTGNETHPESAIGTGKYGILTNPITAALIPGAEGTPAAFEAASSIGSGLRDAGAMLRGGKSAEEAPSIVQQVLKGKGVAQEPAQSAVRATIGAEEGTPLLEGNKTILDNKLSEIRTAEKAAYKPVDDLVGFDLKDAQGRLLSAERRGTLNTPANQKLAQQVAEAEEKVKTANIDTSAGDVLHRQRMAGQDFKKLLVRTTSPDGESVNVDSLIKGAKQLRFSKYGDRLTQFMGPEGADRFMAELQRAQDIGAHGMKVQAIAKMLGKYVGYGIIGAEAGRIAYEAAH